MSSGTFSTNLAEFSLLQSKKDKKLRGSGLSAGESLNRLIESSAKCRYRKKFTCKGTLRQVFYLAQQRGGKKLTG